MGRVPRRAKSTMSRSLAENIERGRRAIAVARDRGIDTDEWEQRLAELEQQSLLAWASEIAEGTEMESAVQYVEAPLRTVTTERVSWYAGHYLRTITYARMSQATGGWGSWTPKWWCEREQEAIGALYSLREAVEGTATEGAR